MKWIKLAIISSVVLFVMLLCVGLLLPSTIVISRAIEISAPKDNVYNTIKNINDWYRWMEGVTQENSKIIHNNLMDIGGMTIEMIDTNQNKITILWHTKNKVYYSEMQFIQTDPAHPTLVQWEFVDKPGWLPWERLQALMYEKILGEQMEKTLSRLRTFCTKGQ